jgi:cytochrome c oxidase assembly protein subunit 15
MKKIVLISIFLAMIVIVLAAYTRLSDAGLGCTDWPGCYGHTSFSKTTKNIEHAQQAIFEPHFEMYKTWNEMIQRYLASALGFLVLVIFINRIFSKTYDKPVKSAFLLSFLVCIQVC